MKINSALIFISTCLVFSKVQSQPVQRKIDSVLSLFKYEINLDKKAIYLLYVSKAYKKESKVKSLKYAKEAMAYAEGSKYDTLRKMTLSRLAIAFYETDDFQNAFKFYKRQLAIEKSLTDYKGQANTIFNIALLYHASDDPVNSQKYLKKAKAIIATNEIHNKNLTVGIDAAMGTNYYKMDMLDSAEKYYQKALKSILIENLTDPLISNYYNMAELYFKRNERVKCSNFIDLMHNAEIEQNDFGWESYHLYLSSRIKLDSGDLMGAKQKAFSAIKLAKENGSKESAQLASIVLTEINEKLGELDSAYYYSKLSKLYFDSLKGSSIKNLLQFSDTEMEDNELAMLNLEIKYQRRLLILLVSGILLFVLLLAIILKFLKREKLLRRDIESKNGEISKQNLKLLTQTNEMGSLMNTMEEILKEQSSKINNLAFYNSHRLRAPIARIVGLGKLGRICPTIDEKLYISNKIYDVTEELDIMSKEGQRLLDNN